MKYTLVAYRQYGQWYTTLPFERRDKAEVHANGLRDNTITDKRTGYVLAKNTNEHIKEIMFVEIELPD